MASYAMEDFVGNGVLKGQLPKLLEEGWDDVPTLKIMNAEDMDAINMTQQQKVGLYCESASHSPPPHLPSCKNLYSSLYLRVAISLTCEARI